MLGIKIRAKRQEQKLTMKELAERVGLTAGFLSQIERDMAEPSITSLRKIANVLKVPMFYFLEDDRQYNLIVRKKERKVLKLGKGDVIFELLSPNLNRTIEMTIGRLQPGAVTCDEPLMHYGEENLLVMHGEMKIQIGDDFYTLQEGDSIYYVSSTPHKIWNIGQTELVFISAITPPEF